MLIDTGTNGRENYGHIFNNSVMAKAIENNELDTPTIGFMRGHKLPYVIVSDDIFALKTRLMKIYGGISLSRKKKFLSPLCCCSIENTFGITSARWRILDVPFKITVDDERGNIRFDIWEKNFS